MQSPNDFDPSPPGREPSPKRPALVRPVVPWFILLLVVVLSATVAAYVDRTDRLHAAVAAALVLACGCGVGLLLLAAMLAEVRARRSAEQIAADLNRSQGALRESERRFRTLIEQSPLGIQVFAPDGSVSLANHAWEELWDARLSDLSDYNVLQDPQLERAGLADSVRQAFAGQTVMIPPFRYDPAAIGKPGRARWVQLHLYPAKDESGAVREVVLILHDVSDVKASEQERSWLLAAEREARAEAEAANRTKDEFLATLSHELRTPLNAILGWAQLLQMPGMPREEFQHGLATIERNAKAQAQLVEDLLDLSRIISGKLRLDMKPVDLGPLIRTALDSVRPGAEAKGIRLIDSIDPCAKPVMGDAHRLQQVVWNLLSNAIKFTPADGRVECALRCEQAEARIVVSDTGVGISPQFLPHVFDRLRQADSSSTRRHGGLGLGLAIVRHLVESHGGTVSAHSEGEGRGAAFTVRLPLIAAAANTDGNGSRQPGQSARPAERLRGLRVLVVDDEPDARDLMGRVLGQAGAKVRTAASAAEALAAMDEAHPDLLLSDIAMPREDGYELLRLVRARDDVAGSHTPAIALTAYARHEDRQRALNAGFQAHLAKPVEPAELIATVANVSQARSTHAG